MLKAFGGYALDLDRQELSRAESILPLKPEAFIVLVHRHAGIPCGG
jgi:hypothetical protein